MEIWMTSSTSNAQFSAAFEAGRQIMEPAFNSRFAGTPYGPGLIELQYRALPHAPHVRRYGEVKKYFRTLHSVHIRTRLQMPPDLNGNDVLYQIALSLERSVDRLRRMRIPDFDIERFAEDFAQFTAEREWVDTMCESVIAVSQWPWDNCEHRLQETEFGLTPL